MDFASRSWWHNSEIVYVPYGPAVWSKEMIRDAEDGRYLTWKHSYLRYDACKIAMNSIRIIGESQRSKSIMQKDKEWKSSRTHASRHDDLLCMLGRGRSKGWRQSKHWKDCRKRKNLCKEVIVPDFANSSYAVESICGAKVPFSENHQLQSSRSWRMQISVGWLESFCI